jgi:Carboxypeptidase regulatory-like domain
MRVLACLAGLLLFCAAAWAQTTAQINGTVKDQTGAVLPGAEIKATQTATGGVRTAVSSEDGGYVLPNLPVGPYVVEVSLPGFRTYVQSGIVLQVGSNPIVNAILQVGQVSEQIEVAANAALVETTSTTIGTVVDNQRVVELPLNGRNATELIFLAGMASIGGSGFLNSVRNYPTVMISVTGGVANWTTYNFDGTAHNDAYNSLNLPLPFPDALQEFKVESSALPAQYGMHASAQVNVITKSGTNDFHGDVFEFVRNGYFNARDAFAPTRDTLKRNQFGGVIGGPIKKNKLFFFGGYQGTIQRSEPTQNIAYVPTAAMLAGDFTAIASPLCNNGRQITLAASQGFANNTISPTLFSPAALKIQARLPLATDPCGRVTFGLKSNQSEHMEVTRLDWQKSDKNSIFGRFFVTNLHIDSTYDGKNALTLNSNGQKDRVYALALGQTYLFGANVVSSFRIGANRSEIPKIVDNFATWPELGVNAPFNPAPSPRLSVTGNGFAIGSGNSIINSDMGGPNPNISEDISWVKGNHQFGFGASYFYTLLNYKSGINATGLLTFDGSVTNLSLADFLVGQARQWAQGNVQSYLYNRQQYFGAYIQDSWKINPRLTMNYGIRWEPFFAFKNKFGWFDHFDPALFAQNAHSTVYTNAPAGLIFPGDKQWTAGDHSIASNRYGVFLPRLGFSWNPNGDGKTSIRASIGMFTDRGALYSMSAMAQDAPFGSVVTIPNVRMTDPWATYPGGNPLPIPLTKDYKFPIFASYVTDDLHWKPTWVNQFNLSVQRQVGTDWLFTVNYVGNTTSHLTNESQINPAIYFPGAPVNGVCTYQGYTLQTTGATCSTTANTNQRRLLYLQNPVEGQYYGIIATTDNGGTASYNGLYLQAQKRLSHGASILANYTWSHCISDLWNGNPGNNGVSNATPFNRRNDRGHCDSGGAQSSDLRHIFNLSVVAQTPKFANLTLRKIAGDWQFSPILKMRSGYYFTVTTGQDNALNGQASSNQRPNLVPGVNPYATDKNADHWLNPAAFIAPASGTLGTLARNGLQGPGMFQLDMAVSRTFPVGEGRSIQLRGEAFNLPNHVNLSIPVAMLNNSAAFGKIQSDISGTSGLSTGDPRIMQFALKFVF